MSDMKTKFKVGDKATVGGIACEVAAVYPEVRDGMAVVEVDGHESWVPLAEVKALEQSWVPEEGDRVALARDYGGFPAGKRGAVKKVSGHEKFAYLVRYDGGVTAAHGIDEIVPVKQPSARPDWLTDDWLAEMRRLKGSSRRQPMPDSPVSTAFIDADDEAHGHGDEEWVNGFSSGHHSHPNTSYLAEAGHAALAAIEAEEREAECAHGTAGAAADPSICSVCVGMEEQTIHERMMESSRPRLRSARTYDPEKVTVSWDRTLIIPPRPLGHFGCDGKFRADHSSDFLSDEDVTLKPTGWTTAGWTTEQRGRTRIMRNPTAQAEHGAVSCSEAIDYFIDEVVQGSGIPRRLLLGLGTDGAGFGGHVEGPSITDPEQRAAYLRIQSGLEQPLPPDEPPPACGACNDRGYIAGLAVPVVPCPRCAGR